MTIKESIIQAKENMLQVATDVKMGYATAAATTTTGAGTILDYIPDNIGKLTTVIGFILSIAIFYFQYAKHQREQKIHEADLILKNQEILLNQAKINDKNLEE